MNATLVNPQSVLQTLEQVFTDSNVLHLLKNYQMLPQLLQEMIVDQAIAAFSTTAAEDEKLVEDFFAQRQLQTSRAQQQWLSAQGITQEDLLTPLRRELRIEKFKQVTWGHKVESYFLKRKADLDQVVYSIIQHEDSSLITELFFRLQEGEATFAELAAQHSQSLSAKTKGVMGPVELGNLHPNLAEALRRSQPQTLTNIRMGNWFVVAQVEVKFSAQLDDEMRQRLLNELYTQWLQQEVEGLKQVAC